MSESTEQQALVQWFRYQYPQYLLVSIPNGQWIAGNGKQRAQIMAKYKAEGLEPGMPDLLLCVKRGGYGALFIEMKDKGKTRCSVSKPQREKLGYLNEAGYRAEWAAGWDQAKRIIEEYLSLTPPKSIL